MMHQKLSMASHLGITCCVITSSHAFVSILHPGGTMKRDPNTHVDNATDHHAWVVLRLLVEHVLGEPLVSGGEVFRHPLVDPHALVLRHQLLAASHESLVLEAEPRWIQCHVIRDALQLHWNASVHTLHLIETVQATQHVNPEVHTWLCMMRQSVEPDFLNSTWTSETLTSASKAGNQRPNASSRRSTSGVHHDDCCACRKCSLFSSGH